MGKYILPCIMILLNLGQAVVCIYKHDPVTALYWGAAATLNLTVALKQ